MPPEVLWLVGGTCISTWSLTLLYCVQACMRTCWSNINDVLFLWFCRHFEVPEHTLRDLNNGTACPRLLSEIGLLTMRHNWKHEANAES